VTLTQWSFSMSDGTVNRSEGLRMVLLPPSGDLMRWSMAYSPDEDYVALAAKDRTARVWETAGGREVARIGFDKEVTAVAFGKDGGALTTVSGGVAESWETEYGPTPLRLEHGGEVRAVAVSPGGEWLVTASAGGARLFRTSDWSGFRTLDAVGPASGLNFSPDGRWLVVKGEKKAAIFDTRTWAAVHHVAPLEQEKDLGMIYSGEREADLGFSPDGRWLVVEDGRSVKLLEAGSWREARSFRHSDPVREVSFSPDGRRLSVAAAGQYRRGVQRIFDARARAFVWGLDDGGLLACGTIEDDYTPRAKESGRAAEAVPCPDVKGHAHESLFAEAQGWEKVAKSRDGRPSSPDGRWTVEVEGADISLAFKEGNTRRKVANLSRDAEGWAFTPDSRWLVLADERFVRLWPLKPADMIATACARLRRRRDLPAEVWQRYFSGTKSEPTCGPSPPRANVVARHGLL
jgi:WD40 repeat protein